MTGLTLLILLLAPEFCLGFKYESSSNLWNFRTPVIGIDFGTTYSRVGVYNNGSVDIISDDRGNRAIPSLVAFTETGGRLFGEAAENQLARNPERTIFHVKRLIGRMFDDPEVQRELKRLPYKVVNKDGKPYIEVKIRDGEMAEVYSPEEISAMIIENIKEMAEYYLGKKIHKAVVTVPAYFNEAQRQATKDAYALAGLTVVHVFNEPTAAAIAFGLYEHAGINPKSILVVDLGGGTFDFSVLTIDEGVIEVISNISHTNLGCEDFNRRLTDYDRDISQDKLRKESERAKRALSRQHQVQVEIDDFFSESLTRDRFEEMSADLFGRMVGPVERALKDANLEVDEIVVVGGCTRIPRVKEMLSGYFGGKELLSNIGRVLNPDEAVAYGAAIQGWILKELPHLAWNELSLGIETAGGVMTKLIPRNTIMPIRRAQVFSTCKHNQTTVSIKVYDGERALTRDCRQLGSFQLSGIPPAPRGVPQIVVNFEVDENYILKVTAAQAKKLKSFVSITLDVHPRTTKDKIQEKIRDAEEFTEEDRKAKEKFGYNMEMECSDNEMIELPQDTLVLDDGKKKFSDRKEEVEEESKDEL